MSVGVSTGVSAEVSAGVSAGMSPGVSAEVSAGVSAGSLGLVLTASNQQGRKTFAQNFPRAFSSSFQMSPEIV